MAEVGCRRPDVYSCRATINVRLSHSWIRHRASVIYSTNVALYTRIGFNM